MKNENIISSEQHALEAICGHLSERTAVLFLGAGINATTKAKDGSTFPLGTHLSNLITTKLLEDNESKIDLIDAADMGRRKFGDEQFNKFIYDEFNKFPPSTAHFTIAQLPWNSIYTTNYDLLIENAFANSKTVPAGKIRAIFSESTDLSTLNSDDIPYYKIHGSIDFANTAEGRLILTRDDYRKYQENRMSLFRRLHNDLLSKTFVFIGYGLGDENFRTILDEVREALGTQGLPPSFAIKQSFSKSEADYWKDKYNVQLIKADGSLFLVALRDYWHSKTVEDFHEQWSSPIAKLSESGQYKFPQIGVSFYRLIPEACVGSSHPDLFYKGGSYSWTDARDKVAPNRDQYWTLMEALYPDLIEPTLIASNYLVTGHAGTGKTTLCRSIAFDLANDLNVTVLLHIPGTPLDAGSLGVLVNKDDPKRIVVMVRDGATYIDDLSNFLADLKRLKLPVSVIIEERKNEWLYAGSKSIRKILPLEIELGMTSDEEIERILDNLEKFNCLGKLKGIPREHQRSHFSALAQKELLVALRELTLDSKFDEIITDEYNSIPSNIAKKAYLFVAAVGQANVSLRYEHLIKLTGVNYTQLGTEILSPTDKILIDGEVVGNSRHYNGYTLRTRHPIIASVIFSIGAPKDEDKYQILSDIITLLDQGFIEDKRLLEELVRQESILNTLADPERKRAIFDLLARKLPDNPYVYQHRSMLERNLSNPEGALKYARQALDIQPFNIAFKNTYGFSLMMMAKNTSDNMKKQTLLNQAEKLFDEAMLKDPTNPYSYLGMANILRIRAEELPQEEKAVILASILTLLEDAYEITNKSEIIANLLAEEQKHLGEISEALQIVKQALNTKPNDTKLRILEARLEQISGNVKGALNAVFIGLKNDPNSWKLNHQAARLLRETNGEDSAIRGYYEAARRHQKGNLGLTIEYAAFLFSRKLFPRAAAVFNEAQNLMHSTTDKRNIKEWWKESENSKKNKIFKGVIKSIKSGSGTVIAIPENFEASFWQTKVGTEQYKINDSVSFMVGFNSFGAQARII